MIYTGIGSRSTPGDVLAEMKDLAIRLAEEGYTLRSGGAPGADTAFEQGCIEADGDKEIYLPWKEFNNNPSPHYLPYTPPIDWKFYMAEKFHPRWSRLTSAARKFMIRNCQQVFGEDGTKPSDFIICWTSDGKASGGTGQALRIAKCHDIPVYNLFNMSADFVRSVVLPRRMSNDSTR